MKRLLATLAALSTVAAICGSGVLRTGSIPTVPSRPAIERPMKVPLAFEPNLGQADPRTRFLSHGLGSTVSLTTTGVAMSLAMPGATQSARSPDHRFPQSAAQPSRAVEIDFQGANPEPQVVAAHRLPGVSNYFVGNDPSRWVTGVPHYARVVYRDLYPGIDLSFFGNRQGRLEYDLSVAPGADPSLVRLSIRGADEVSLDPRGDLVLRLGGQEIVQPVPGIYQEVAGSKLPVTGGYVLNGTEIGFTLGSYDRAAPLVIDPQIVYSTYLGGGGDEIGEIHPDVDSAGHAFICGTTDSTDFPVTLGVVQPTIAGSFDSFVTEMSADGSAVVFSTYLGGAGNDDVQACQVDSLGDVYVGGITDSADFPTTPGALQTAFGGGTDAFTGDGFVAKLGPGGSSLLYSTFLGGSLDENLNSVQIDTAGDAFVAGDTFSTDFPTTAGAYQTSNADGQGVQCPGLHSSKRCNDEFVAKLNPAGSALVYSTYLGGRGSECCQPGLAVDDQGDAYIEGTTSSHSFPTTPGALQPRFAGGLTDTFVTKLNPAGSALVYSTYLGGSGPDLGSLGIAVDGSGNAYVDGYTCSNNFPVTPGAFQLTYAGPHSSIFRVCGDGFVSKINPQGSAFVYSTYLGGSTSWEYPGGPLVDSAGHAYIPGFTFSTDFPVTSDAVQATNAGEGDGTLTEFSTDGSAIVFSSYLGGSLNEGVNGIALDSSRNLYATGCTESNDYPTTPGALQTTFQGGDAMLGFSICGGPTDAFVTKIAFGT